MQRIMLLPVIFMVSALLLACAPEPVEPVTKPIDAEAPVEPVEAKKSWEIEWERIIKEARKEKRIHLHAATGWSEIREPLTKLLREKFGIAMDFTTARAAELVVKILAERRAGIYNVDISLGGPDTFINQYKPQGILEPLEPQLLLPEVVDGRAWLEGRVPWLDRDKFAFSMIAYISPPAAINTRLVKKEEVKSYFDFLNPKWKGKIVMNDPTSPGSGYAWFNSIIYTRILDLDYMRRLAQMELTISRDQRWMVESLAHGRFLIGIGVPPSQIREFKDAGAPVEQILPVEGAPLHYGSGIMGLINRAPNPNAARIFVNWILSREGQMLVSKATGFQSARVDVPTNHLSPVNTRQPGIKYPSIISEEFTLVAPDINTSAAEIFGPLMR